MRDGILAWSRWLPGSGLVRFLYNNNPFYVLSAGLVLYGLRQCVATEGGLTAGWLLMSLLCGYTLLLAVAAAAIIRWGQVWEDARTILLVLVLMFLALSVSFDELLLLKPARGARFLMAGFLFAVAVSEGVLCGLKIRLPALYRLPYYLMLGLLFAYPAPLAMLSVRGLNDYMTWGVFLFSFLSALCLLTLLPAARWGRRLAAASGTPWRWPYFPWSLFVVLAVCLVLRTCSLSVAFEASAGTQSCFGLYFLLPPLMAFSLLFLELAVAARSRGWQYVGLALPLLLLPLAFPGESYNALQFRWLSLLSAALGSPPQMAGVLGLGFYFYAWLRELPGARAGMVTSLLLLSVVNRYTLDVANLCPPQPLPLDAAAALLLAEGALHRRSISSALGCALGLVSLSLHLGPAGVPAHGPYVPAHALAILVGLLGLVFNDGAARNLRRAIVVLLPAAALAAVAAYDELFPRVPNWFHVAYVGLLTLLGSLYWRLYPTRPYFAMALATAGMWLASLGKQSYRALHDTALDGGRPWLAGGLLVLALGFVISLLKGGVLLRLWRMRWSREAVT